MNECGEACLGSAEGHPYGAQAHCGVHDTWWVMTQYWYGVIIPGEPAGPSHGPAFWRRTDVEPAPPIPPFGDAAK